MSALGARRCMSLTLVSAYAVIMGYLRKQCSVLKVNTEAKERMM